MSDPLTEADTAEPGGLNPNYNPDAASKGRMMSELLCDITRARLCDLAERKSRGMLTAAEQLALVVLTGTVTGDEVMQLAFLDAARET